MDFCSGRWPHTPSECSRHCRNSKLNTQNSQLNNPLPLRTHAFRHGAFEVELIGPRSPDDLIDVSEFNRDERLPYWAELWPSARALAAHFLDAPPPRGRVLELGCGLALPSLALRWRGAEVVASDYYAEALEFTIANARRNHLPPPETLLLDWREPPADLAPFELVIAADVLYEMRNGDALAALLPRVTAPDGRVLLADPGRAHLEHFRTAIERQGWRMDEIGRRSAPGPVEGRNVSVGIFLVSRRIRPVSGRARSCTQR